MNKKPLVGNSKSIDRQLVDAQTLAYRYSVATKTIRKWGHEGKLPFVRLSGKCTRYSLEECDAIIDGLRVKEVTP